MKITFFAESYESQILSLKIHIKVLLKKFDGILENRILIELGISVKNDELTTTLLFYIFVVYSVTHVNIRTLNIETCYSFVKRNRATINSSSLNTSILF